MLSLKPPITVVLGAGSSKPFHLPVGTELRDSITKGLYDLPSNPQDPRRHQHMVQATLEQAQRLGKLLRSSGCRSIDQFLEHHRDLERTGKILIAASLWHLEHEAITSDPANDWIETLFNKARALPLMQKNDLRFVSFNYDQILRYRLEAMFRLNKLEAELPEIVHVYGKLGSSFFWSDEHLGFQATVSPYQVVARSIDSIKLMNDHRSQATPDMDRAKNLVRTAGTLIFLGFGFDEVNLARIGISRDDQEWQASQHNILATAFGLLDAERSDALSLVHQRAMNDPQRGRCFGGEQEGCDTLLRKHLRWRIR